jgi:hypothetical protein
MDGVTITLETQQCTRNNGWIAEGGEDNWSNRVDKSSAWEAANMETERMKLKNLHC